MDVPIGQSKFANKSEPRLKRGRPVGSKDKNPRARKGAKTKDGPKENIETLKESSDIIDISVPEETDQVPEIHENKEISINYVTNGIQWNRLEINVDDIFAYNIALNVINDNEDQEPKSIKECRQSENWPKWKDAIEAELNSLNKRKVFGPVVRTPKGVKPIGYKWVFVRKRNENGEVARYKARLVAHGFSQRPRIDFDETYSHVVDAATFRYLISLIAHEGLNFHMLDVVTAHLYGSLDSDIYMKLPKGFNLPEANSLGSREDYSIKLYKSLYGLKQSGRMWYNRLSEYLLREGYKNDSICPCIFMKRSGNEFAIIAIYVDDINIIRTPEELPKAIDCLKKEFEMKDLGKTKFCLALQIEHLNGGILVHQEAYITKVLKRFYMEKSHPLSTPMVVRSLDVENDPFRLREEGEELLGPEVLYLSAIGALMYLANNTRPDISFSVNIIKI